MSAIGDNWIVSKAHEWVQALPLSDGRVVCNRCNLSTKIGHWDISRCTPHYEDKDSGFIPE